MTRNFRSTLTAAIALSLASLPIPAAAAGFTPEGKAHWIEVVHALIDAANQDQAAMSRACQGVNRLSGGSEIRHEYFQVPKWAVQAHFQTCVAYQFEATGGGFFKRGDACKGLQAAIKELDKAKPGVDPDDIVTLAGQLKETLISLAGDYKDARTCTFGMGKAK